MLVIVVNTNLCGAQTSEGSSDKPLDGYLGAGAVVFPKYSGSASHQTWPLPLASFEYRDTAYIHINRAGVRFWNTDDKKMALGVAAQPRFGFSANDGSRLSGMSGRRDRIEGGPSFEWETPAVSLSATYFTDWSNAASGQAAALSLYHQLFDDAHWDVGTYVEIEYLNRKTVQYYFGVRPGEATVSRPSYEPGATLNSSFGISGAYKLGNGYALMFGTTLEILGTAAANSPIVERRSGLTSYLGLGMVF